MSHIFNSGDLVQCLSDQYRTLVLGEVYAVQYVDRDHGLVKLMNGTKWRYYIKDFKLVEKKLSVRFKGIGYD